MYDFFALTTIILKEESFLKNMQSETDEVSKLENFIKDVEYRERLIESSRYYPWVNYELQKLNKLEMKLKEKMKIPLKSLIKFEKIKCSKTCSHNHQYFYAYFWDCYLNKLNKKYIGKNLPNTE
jgi:hypothetical protein